MAWDTLRFLQALHGHAGWLVAALLVHPARLMRIRPALAHARRARRIALLAALSTSLTYAAGFALYGDYRTNVRRSLFEVSPALGYCFERKEHLATLALLLAWLGAIAVWRVRTQPDEAAHAAAHRKSGWLFLAAAVCAVVTALLGTAVASVKSL